MRFNPTIMDNQVPHRDPRRRAAPMQPEEKGRPTADFLRSFKEGPDWGLGAPGREAAPGDNQAAPGESEGERERHTNTTARNTPPHKTKQVFGHSYQKHSDYWT